MSDETSPPPSPSAPSNRRASLTPGQKLSELFSRSPPTASGTTAYPGPITTAAANAQAQQRRRTSMTLGLGGSPTSQTSPFSTHARNRRTSFGSSNSPSDSIEESAVEEGEAPSPPPTSPFVRRMSFGARALRDAKNGGAMGNANGRASKCLASAPSVKGRGDGFDWSEQIKNRAERSASVTQRPAMTSLPAAPPQHARAVSIAAIEQPVKQMPTAPREPMVPDHFQERILKGDFYMD